jgi:hypothetical protein
LGTAGARRRHDPARSRAHRGRSALHDSAAQTLSPSPLGYAGASSGYALPPINALHLPARHTLAAALVKPGPPPTSGKSILETVPRVGAFDLTFYSDTARRRL